uniref:Uncharacterized protein n=1 Tax=uncultured gamma proteobacterium EB750_07C09 TaxID=710974 RepID=E0Y324_9GAMM|nr:hypothetical protein [uncultured gamma proteobacterium EB750_07C09]
MAAGFTTIRNLGAYGGWSGRDIRDFINTGLVAGPRIQTCRFLFNNTRWRRGSGDTWYR